MFRKFDFDEDVSGQTQVKSSVQRAIKSKIVEQSPVLEDVIDEMLPKKATLVQLKCRDRISLFTLDGRVMFFNSYDGPMYPTLRLLHQYPDMLPRVQVDRGAIKFVLSGANIMAPGLTSKGGRLPDAENPLPKDTIVAIMAEGKQHACAIGYLLMDSEEIKNVNKGIAIEVVHALGDDLWKHDHMSSFKPAKFGTVLGVTDGGCQVYSCDSKSMPWSDVFGMSNYYNGEYTGMKWQCVELARRYLLINHGVVFESITMAYQIFQLQYVRRVSDHVRVPMSAHPNGSRDPPVKGSLLIWEPRGFFTRTGHVAVIIGVGRDYVDVVEQNVQDRIWPAGVLYSRRLPIGRTSDGGMKIKCTYSDSVVLGWMNINYSI